MTNFDQLLKELDSVSWGDLPFTSIAAMLSLAVTTMELERASSSGGVTLKLALDSIEETSAACLKRMGK